MLRILLVIALVGFVAASVEMIASQQHSNETIAALEGFLGASECDAAKYLRNAGFSESQVPTMVCIAKYESSFNCGATNKNNDGSTDYGMWQINSYYWCSGDPTSEYNECHASCSSLMDCQKNANCAHTVYKQQGYKAWYAYQSHKSTCDSYKINC